MLKECDLVADPATGDSELSLEVEVAKSGEKPVEDSSLDVGEVDFIANMELGHWCAAATSKRRRRDS